MTRPAASASRPSRPRRLIAGGIVAALLVVAAVGWMLARRASAPDATSYASAAPEAPAQVAGSESCAGCHADQHARWRGSQHAAAMQLPGDTTVLGDFSGAKFTHRGITSEFFRRDAAFVVRTDGPDGALAEYEVRHTFGVYPLQQYLLELPGGRLQALSIAWDARPRQHGGQRWFHLHPDEPVDHRDELHWTRRQYNWNHMCADCHSTQVVKNYDAASDSFATRWAEISVGCEACHGPGSRHIERMRRAAAEGATPAGSGFEIAFDERRGVKWLPDAASGTARRSQANTTRRELDVCAQCHSRRGQFSDAFRPGQAFTDHYLPSSLTEPEYHADGQQLGEVFNWGSFVSSRMHAAGVTCSDCHEPHDGSLRATGNAVCTQCHQPAKFDTTAHHFHAPNTDGSRCTSCHMRTATYMVVDPRHDHSFRIPRPDLSVTTGLPNACGDCHAARGAAWAAAQIQQRYPQARPGLQDFAQAFDAFDRHGTGADDALPAIAASPAGSAIARASALARLSQAPGEPGLRAAAGALRDDSPVVRRAALEVFAALPPLQRRELTPMLADPSRIVRMEAVNLLAPLADDAFDATALAAFTRASDEYIAAERRNADRPEHRSNLGGYFADRGRSVEAEAEYRAALRLDPLFVPARVNLAELLRATGREAEAEAALREGIVELPRDPSLHHALGLSLVRQQRADDALVELRQATHLGPTIARFAYVYAVALHSSGHTREAVAVLRKAAARWPADREIAAALADFAG